MANIRERKRCRIEKQFEVQICEKSKHKKGADSFKKRGADLTKNTSLKKGAEMQRKAADLKSVLPLGLPFVMLMFGDLKKNSAET